MRRGRRRPSNQYATKDIGHPSCTRKVVTHEKVEHMPQNIARAHAARILAHALKSCGTCHKKLRRMPQKTRDMLLQK